jgi:hypothetical protein
MTSRAARFVKENNVRISVSYGAPENPEFKESDGWTVTLKMDGRQMTVPFYKGYGHHGAKPTAEEVLECLAMDAEGIKYFNTFEDWCREYGYDADSRRAEKIYHDCVKYRKKLQRFLGDKFADLVWGG